MRLKVKRTPSGNVFINRRKAVPYKYREGRRCVGSIFLEGDVFIKFGKKRAPLEREVYEKAREDGVEHYLAPLVKSGVDWNAFRRVNGEECHMDDLDDDQLAVLEWLRDKGYYDHCCEGNFVVKDDGSLVIIDCEP